LKENRGERREDRRQETEERRRNEGGVVVTGGGGDRIRGMGQTNMTRGRRAGKSKLPKLIEKHYADLRDLERQHVMYEMGIGRRFMRCWRGGEGAGVGVDRGAFQEGEWEDDQAGWDVQGWEEPGAGYWEAKDTDDVLGTEIEKKRKAGYPLNNTIFEDTATAVLYQNGQAVLTAEIKDGGKLLRS